MRLILIGCEYAGKTTLANEITKWLKETTGGGRTFHDHFTIPPSELPEAEQAEFLRELTSDTMQSQWERERVEIERGILGTNLRHLPRRKLDSDGMVNFKQYIMDVNSGANKVKCDSVYNIFGHHDEKCR